ncbi:DUF4179 domain-containing protein [Anaerotignum sp. MB30-C6]|uniref:DUF4179 domain-containing protein n=1 Tax=Anaerotignum sp. MB30-C6 TaxID=3070814 RepID=UPI0027DD70D9|nr:DUF4179 domain-containing protein [Anaerotignum sp. MB30-C6]WMI80029.1 DUF4179 domain-containing protein [Anaerotignum sp. MB30-C6]
MKQYKNEMDNLHWTQAGKENLINRVKANAQQEPRKGHFSIGKYVVIAAAVCLFSVTAYATGILQSASDVFAPILGGTPVQTEIIEKIGHPVGASDTSDGITITADAIIADSNHACIVYSIANADGSPFALPEGVLPEDVFFAGGKGGTELPFNIGGLNGSSWIADTDNTDGTLQYIEMLSTEKPLPAGKKVTAEFSRLSYFDTDGKAVVLSEGDWKIRYELNFEDVGVKIPVEKEFVRDGLTFTVHEISLSPIALQANYTVDAIPEWSNEESGQLPEQDQKEHFRFMDTIELFITKTDGTIIDLTNSGGGLSVEDGVTMGYKGTVLEEIVPLNEIVSITVGDVVIDVNI